MLFSMRGLSSRRCELRRGLGEGRGYLWRHLTLANLELHIFDCPIRPDVHLDAAPVAVIPCTSRERAEA